MTICIGSICEQESAVILVTDSMIINPGLSIQFEHSSRKMTRLSESCIALTAGDALAHTELFNVVSMEVGKLRKPSITEIVTKIKDCYQDIRKREIRENILMPRGFDNFSEFYQSQRQINSDIAMAIQNQIEHYNYGLSILLGGVSEGVAHIYEVSDPGTSKCFDAIGFAAIGSGLPHAINTLIARQCNQKLSLEDALLITYEAKKMAEKAPGVGSHITDISIIKKGGTTEIPRGSIAQLHSIYERWAQKESGWKEELTVFLEELGVNK